MEIRIRETGQVVSENEFRAMHRNVSFPAVLSAGVLEDFGADAVLAAPAPTVTDTQAAHRDGVTRDALGNWVYAWAVRELTPEEIEARKPPVPQSVTMRQARLALLESGRLAEVSLIISSLPSPQKDMALIEWEYALYVERQNPLFIQIAMALGLTQKQVDDLFIVASKL